MKTRRFSMITLMILFAMPLFTCPLSGCTRPNAQDTVDKLLSYLQSAEYPRIYALLTPSAKEKITLVDLSRRYDDVYRSIGLTKAECQFGKIKTVDGSHSTAEFTMMVTADKLGTFKMDMKAPLSFEGGKWLVDWDGTLILPGLEDGCRAVVKTDPAKRGEIFDVNGIPLARNDYALSVYVDSSKVRDYETTIRLLAPKLGMTEAEIRGKLQGMMKVGSAMNTEGDDVPAVAAGVSGASPSPSPSATPAAGGGQQPDTVERSYAKVIKAFPRDGLTWQQQQDLLDIPGVGIDDSWMTVIRSYPFGNLLSQTLGYTGVMSADDLAKPENAGLPRDAVVGRAGLEKSCELSLRSRPGYELYIADSQGKRKTTLAVSAGADGSDLRLTIDLKLQQRAEMLLRQNLTPQMAGCVVVLDPKTGYIQALASAPSFDPNLFSFPVSAEVMAFLNDPVNMKPQINRATTGKYPPGSTFKPFTASMGLADGKITPSFVFPYEIRNNYWTPGDSFGVDTAIKRKDPTPPPLNLKNAITYSDNIFFAYTALKVGGDKFYKHCEELGLGLDAEHRMTFDLPLASSSITNSGRMDDLRRLADSGYGQGQLLITPVQMAATFGSLANGGDIMQPRLVQSVCHTDGPRYVTDKTNPPEVWRAGVVPTHNLDLLLPALKRVAEIGTAKALNQYRNLSDYEICAKTGTAEIGTDKTREIAWIIGFATKKMDRLVCVTLEVPAGEGGIRTEIAKGMFEE